MGRSLLYRYALYVGRLAQGYATIASVEWICVGLCAYFEVRALRILMMVRQPARSVKNTVLQSGAANVPGGKSGEEKVHENKKKLDFFSSSGSCGQFIGN